MTEPAVAPEILALQKRRKRYRKMCRFAFVGIITLAVTPALFSHVLAFTLYGIALFGVIAIVSHWLHGRVDEQLIARGY